MILIALSLACARPRHSLKLIQIIHLVDISMEIDDHKYKMLGCLLHIVMPIYDNKSIYFASINRDCVMFCFVLDVTSTEKYFM